MVLVRIALVLLCACSQSLFDNNNPSKDGGGGGDDAPVASSCTAPCVGDAGGDFDGTPAGKNGRWRYLEDKRNRSWTPMTATSGVFSAPSDPNMTIKSCTGSSEAACTALPGALLVTSGPATGMGDPAIELTTETTAKVVQISLRVHVPTGQPSQDVRLYRQAREDVLFRGTAIAGTTLEHTITIDALASERLLFALTPSAMGAANVGVQMFVSDTTMLFPQNCQLALSFTAAMGNSVDNLCGGDFTHEDYNAGPQPPTLAAGPFMQQGMAADLVPDKYYVGTNLINRAGDTTVQLWVRHDALVAPYSAWAISDMDLDDVKPGGLGIYLRDNNGLKLGVETCTSGNPLAFAGDQMVYPTDGAWHFVRVVQKGGTVNACLDGTKQFSFAAPVGSLASKYRPHVGRNVVWTPSGAFYDGGIDDVRVFTGALPCD